MVKRITKFFCMIFAVIVVSSFSLPAFAANISISDFAGYLTQDEIAQLTEKTQSFSDETGFNIGIVLTEDIEGKTPMAYSDDIYDETFGINTNGFLILINNDTKEDWISTSGEAILYYADDRISSIHENSKQYIIDGQYYTALDTYLDSFANYYAEGIPSSNQDYTINDNGQYVVMKSLTTGDMGIAIIVALAFAFSSIGIIVSRYKFHSIPNALNYLDKNETAFREKSDTFLRQYTTSVKIETNSGGGGGSSTHTSSGGGTHGGGGSSR